MDELVKQVTAKTGVAEDTVRKVLSSAAEFVKGKLPPQYAGMVDNLVSGQAGAAGGGNPLGNLGGMFGS